MRIFQYTERTRHALAKLPRSAVLILAAASVTGACASGTVREAAIADTGTAAAAPRLDDEVCRNVEVTGTRFPQRICRPRGEWEAADRGQKDAADEYTRQTRENAGVLNPSQDTSGFGSPGATFPTYPTSP